jgi:hypothetical protein
MIKINAVGAEFFRFQAYECQYSKVLDELKVITRWLRSSGTNVGLAHNGGGKSTTSNWRKYYFQRLRI